MIRRLVVAVLRLSLTVLLSRADLFRAKLPGAGFVNADLSGARLTDANLSGAHLNEADLRMTGGLRQAQLDGTHGNERTQLPEGLQRPASWWDRLPGVPRPGSRRRSGERLQVPCELSLTTG
jgi:uncharacterized protein YjbI with pentapeptide repeats